MRVNVYFNDFLVSGTRNLACHTCVNVKFKLSCTVAGVLIIMLITQTLTLHDVIKLLTLSYKLINTFCNFLTFGLMYFADWTHGLDSRTGVDIF